MRVHFSSDYPPVGYQELQAHFAALADTMQMHWQLNDAGKKPRMMLIVSKIDHCLNEFLLRYKILFEIFSALFQYNIKARKKKSD